MLNKMLLVQSLLVCMLTIVLGQPATAQDSEVDLLKKKVELFFDNLTNEKDVGPQKAFDDLLADGPLESREEIKSLIDKYIELKSSEFLEVEAIDAKRIGRHLLLLKYLFKMREFPVVWYFTFYRAPTTNGEERNWVVISVRFDTRFDLLGVGVENSNGKP